MGSLSRIGIFYYDSSNIPINKNNKMELPRRYVPIFDTLITLIVFSGTRGFILSSIGYKEFMV
jgi:hypothetical protein